MNFTPEFYNHPEVKGAVRGDLSLQGVILTRISEKSTRYILFSKSDPKIKGVPQSLVQKSAKASALVPLQFKKEVLNKLKLDNKLK